MIDLCEDTFGLDWIGEFVADRFEPREFLTFEEWMRKHMFLPYKGNRYGGKFQIDRNPTILGPIRAVDSKKYPRVLCVCGAQMFKSTVQQGLMGYGVDQQPGPMMFAFPDQSTLEKRSRRFFKPFIAECPAVNKHCTGRASDIQTEEYNFDTCTVALANMGSANAMRSDPIMYLCRDEISGINQRDKKEADPLSSSAARVNSYGHLGLILDCTTPTVESAPGWADLVKSTWHECWVPCPKCCDLEAVADVPALVHDCDPDELGGRLRSAGFQVLTFEGFHFDSKAEPEVVAKDTFYKCAHCEGLLTDADKNRFMIQHHKWVPKFPGRQVAGFHAAGWYSPWNSFGKIAAKFLVAFRDGDQEALKEHTQQDRALPWKEKTRALKADYILAHKPAVGYPRDKIPYRPVAVLGAFDVQQDEVYYTVRAFGENGASSHVRHGVLPRLPAVTEGDDIEGSTLRLADTVLTLDFECLEDGLRYPVDYWWMDSGYDEDEVYAFCRQRDHLIFPYYASERLIAPWKVEQPEVDPATRKPYEDSVWKYTISSTKAHELFAKRLEVKTDDVGAWWLSDDVDEAYAKHFQYDRKESFRNSKGNLGFRWVQDQGDNHYADNAYVIETMGRVYGVLDLKLDELVESVQEAEPPVGSDFILKGRDWRN